MPTRTERFEAQIAELPRFNLPTSLGVLAATWAGLFFYDFILGDFSSASPYEFNVFRVLIPLAGLAPFFLRLMRPRDIVDDKEAYTTFVRMTTISIVLIVAMAFLGVLPFHFDP